jgi:hypothetical protein
MGRTWCVTTSSIDIPRPLRSSATATGTPRPGSRTAGGTVGGRVGGRLVGTGVARRGSGGRGGATADGALGGRPPASGASMEPSSIDDEPPVTCSTTRPRTGPSGDPGGSGPNTDECSRFADSGTPANAASASSPAWVPNAGGGPSTSRADCSLRPRSSASSTPGRPTKPENASANSGISPRRTKCRPERET